MRLTTKGQVTIPQEIRERLGQLPHSEVEFEIEGDAVRIRKARKSKSRGEQIVAHAGSRDDANDDGPDNGADSRVT
jgi:AbrB family looped-hinge helix DNA binding protein